MPGEREIVITGAGLVTPLGIGVGPNWERVIGMQTGITGIAGDTDPGLPTCRGVVGGLEPSDDVPPKIRGQMKFLNRGSFLGFAAAREAFIASGGATDIEPGRRSLFIASGDSTQAGCHFMHAALKDATNGNWQEVDRVRLNQSTLSKVNPFFLLESILNNLFSFLSSFLDFMGPNTALGIHSPSGTSALELAARAIRIGDADVAIAVGCGNMITEIPIFEMNGLGMLSACRAGVQSFRPFDKERDGFIPGEGGAALFLETSERARRRGARVLASLRGFGNCMETLGMNAQGISHEVSRRSMLLALEEAGADPGDCALVCAHGLASPDGDRSELRSIRNVFGGRKSAVPVCGLKPYTGHLGAASDLGEIILAMSALAEGAVPATLNFREADEEFREVALSGSPQRCGGSHLMTVSYGDGGQSSAVVLEVPRR